MSGQTVHPFTGASFDPDVLNLMSAAFDKAWRSVLDSGKLPSSEDFIQSTRVLIAQGILAGAQGGARTAEALSSAGLAYWERAFAPLREEAVSAGRASGNDLS